MDLPVRTPTSGDLRYPEPRFELLRIHRRGRRPAFAEGAYTDEITAALERELFKDFNLGLRFIYRKSHNIVEDIDTRTATTRRPDDKGSFGSL